MITSTRLRDCSWVPSHFKNIGNLDSFVCSSDPTLDYNCIAHAAGRTETPWWPSDIAGYDWPDGLPKQALGRGTIENFIAAFETEKYEQCADGEIEGGYEKVAIYADQNKIPKHPARSLSNGSWTSKLGDEEDIEHNTLSELSGSAYGTPQAFLRRKIQMKKSSFDIPLVPEADFKNVVKMVLSTSKSRSDRDVAKLQASNAAKRAGKKD